MSAMAPRAPLPVVLVRPEDLPAFCPNPAMPIWNHHPRVFLAIAASGAAMCPYCGTQYRLDPGGGNGASVGH